MMLAALECVSVGTQTDKAGDTSSDLDARGSRDWSANSGSIIINQFISK